ncbi:MAG TPA: DUF937 domain-containing protein [Propionibacteriaceae bacterium]
MSAVDDILADIPMDQLAAQLGVDQTTAEQAARQAIPALLGGMQANSQDPAGAMSLAGALGDHSSDLIDGGVDLNQVDANDGEKIVGNVFGPNQDQVAQTLGGNLGGQAGGLIKQLLPILAPIVLAYLSKRLMGQRQGGGGQDDPLGSITGGGATGSGNPLNDLLSSMLGGSGAPGGGQSSGGSILDMLGGLLGAGRR